MPHCYACAMSEQAPMAVVAAGSLQALRLFDVAYAVDLDRAAAAWQAGGHTAAQRARLGPRAPRVVTWDQPPLLLELGHTTLDVDGRAVTLRAQARVYAFGVICLLLQWPLHDVPWTQVTAQAHQY